MGLVSACEDVFVESKQPPELDLLDVIWTKLGDHRHIELTSTSAQLRIVERPWEHLAGDWANVLKHPLIFPLFGGIGGGEER